MDISKFNLPSGDSYNLKDATARTGLAGKVDKETGKGLSSNDYTTAEKNKLSGVAEGAEVNVNADWNATSGDAKILNKPTLGTASAKDVPSSGNASSTQVVMGNDTRLTNSRPASDVSSWAKASTKPSYTAAEVGAIATSAKGTASGVAELDANGKVPSSQLPSFVDDVIEYTSKSAFPTTGESGKIYIDASTDITYRWSGSAYAPIGSSLALGETSSTAYRGDRGKTAYDHASAKGSAFSSGLYKITTNAQGHVTAATSVAKSDITALGIPGSDTTYSSKSAQSGGTDVSLVTTGEKYTWNSKTSNTGTVTSVGISGSGGITVSGSPVTTSGTITVGVNGSDVINALGEGSSPAQRDDFIVAQYAGGGTTTKTYHRRKLSNIFAALNKSDVTTALGYTPPTQDTTYSDATTSAHGLMTASDKTKLNGIAAGAEVNVNADWNATSGDAQIMNKPTLGTAAAKDVPSSGNASTTQVVMGNDSRLTNSRPASDVSSWAKASTKPSYTASEVGAVSTSGGTISGNLAVTGSITKAGDTVAVIDKIGTITLSASGWVSGSGEFTQGVSITGYTVTSKTKVDLQPSTAVITQMASDGTMALFVDNTNGTLTAHAIENKLSANITVQYTVYEVN